MADVYEGGGVVGTCGHGAVAFANVKLSSGRFLIQGKSVAGFPDSTEKDKSWAKQGTLLPFLVEEQIRRNGAMVINKDNIADKHEVIVDQPLIEHLVVWVAGKKTYHNSPAKLRTLGQ